MVLSLSLKVGRPAERGLVATIDWKDHAPERIPIRLNSDGQIQGGSEFTLSHEYTLDFILQKVGAADLAKGGLLLFGVEITIGVNTNLDANPADNLLDFTAADNNPSALRLISTNAFSTQQLRAPPGREFDLTVNQLVMNFINPGIGLAGVDLQDFGSRERVLFVPPLNLPSPPPGAITPQQPGSALATTESNPANVSLTASVELVIRRILDDSDPGNEANNPVIPIEDVDKVFKSAEIESLDPQWLHDKVYPQLPNGRYQIIWRRKLGEEILNERTILDILLKSGRPTSYEDLEKPALPESESPPAVDEPAATPSELEPPPPSAAESVPGAADSQVNPPDVTAIDRPAPDRPEVERRTQFDPRAEVALERLRERLLSRARLAPSRMMP
ncbi:MAG: hypothetical protein EHM42_05525 [Planctomycetaceae bacterium]|nr:MAG: hypothetical protein EHM42_05525 [Planctomycetaceae bacterium]